VNAGRFRRDLFYRLAVLHVELPPLRERDDDVLLLAKHFLQQLQPQELRVRDFSPAAAGLLRSYAWPGNIRELRNAVERGIALASGHEITPADLPKSLTTTSERVSVPAASEPASDPRGQSLQDAELEYLKSILTINKGNVSRAAEQAGMTRQGLHKRLKKAGLNPGDFRS
jgi:DNA-binding NtrC family response regulator